MWVLPDVVGSEPGVVFCARAGAESTKPRDHHYDGPGNSFWGSLHQSGMTPRLLRPDESALLPSYGLGLTDLVAHRDPTWFEVEPLEQRVTAWAPAWLAVTGKGVAAVLARAQGRRPPGLGVTDLYVGPAQVFVLPGTSGANQRRDYDGRPTRIAWWRDLAELTRDCRPVVNAGADPSLTQLEQRRGDG